MRAQDFVSIRDFAPQQIRHFLDLAVQIKAMPEAYSGALRGKTLAMIFEKPSLRTRDTFDVGIHQLGGFALYLSPAEINLGKRESVYDVAKNLERMVQGVMIRTFAHEIVENMVNPEPAFASHAENRGFSPAISQVNVSGRSLFHETGGLIPVATLSTAVY